MTDHRRAWIDLAEHVRKFDSPEEDFKALLRTVLILPVTPGLETTVIHSLTGGMVNGRQQLAQDLALVLTGQPDFDVPRFLHHATSDDPNGKWSYQVAHPEGEWSRDPADPTSCAKIDIEPA